MVTGLKAVIYPVKNLDESKAMFERLLGVPPAVDAPYYVGFDVPGAHIGLDPNGHKNGLVGSVATWLVENIEESLQSLVDSGAEVNQTITDVGGGILIASLKDSNGNFIGLMQPTA
ncbi:MAG: VOC family protein [Thermomicrobiales bacterium]